MVRRAAPLLTLLGLVSSLSVGVEGSGRYQLKKLILQAACHIGSLGHRVGMSDGVDYGREAIKTLAEVLERFPEARVTKDGISVMLRLARCYREAGELKKALVTAKELRRIALYRGSRPAQRLLEWADELIAEIVAEAKRRGIDLERKGDGS